MVKLTVNALLATASLLTGAVAHPGEHEHHDHEAVAQQEAYARMIQRGLAACETNPDYIALQERSQQRRWQKAQHLRQKRGLDLDAPYTSRLQRRNLATLEADEKINHNYTSHGYNTKTSASKLFASYKNSSCILAPEVTFGPYYVEGELFRSNVLDGQKGVHVHLEYQYIDVSTCKAPTKQLYIETWSANATGVYSGVIANGNGNYEDKTNINKNFLRGVTKVEDGIGSFDALFPGHYSGRATHIHLITHIGGTVFSNGTYKGSNVAHVGQLFFDESLKKAVEATSPYNTNKQAVTSNNEDSWAPDEAGNGYDPLPDWAYLGKDVTDGLLMWITIAVNMSAEYTVTPAATLTAHGGVADSGNALGGGSGSAANGTQPSGSSGAPPSGSGAPSGSPPSGGPGGSSKTTTSKKSLTTKKGNVTTKKSSSTSKRKTTTTSAKNATATTSKKGGH